MSTGAQVSTYRRSNPRPAVATMEHRRKVPMADSSFDIVSKVDRQEADNALNQTEKGCGPGSISRTPGQPWSGRANSASRSQPGPRSARWRPWTCSGTSWSSGASAPRPSTQANPGCRAGVQDRRHPAVGAEHGAGQEVGQDRARRRRTQGRQDSGDRRRTAGVEQETG